MATFVFFKANTNGNNQQSLSELTSRYTYSGRSLWRPARTLLPQFCCCFILAAVSVIASEADSLDPLHYFCSASLKPSSTCSISLSLVLGEGLSH